MCIEIYETINNLNPEFTKSLFKVCKLNRANTETTIQVKFGNPKIQTSYF